jgi:hypothetical protein
VTAVVGEGRAKVASAVPVGIPREVVVGAIERQTELEWVCSKVIWEAVDARPGEEGRIGAPRTHDVEGDFGIG